MPSFLRVRAPSRNEPDDGVASPVAVDHDQDAKDAAEPEQEEPVLCLRMVRVLQQQRVLVSEDRFSLGEGDTMLAAVGGRLARIPLEPKLTHWILYVPRMYAVS